MDAAVLRVHADVEQRHWWFAARRHILRRVVESVVPPASDRTVVDIGCGVGASAPAFHPDYRYIGYDPSADAVRFARETHAGVAFHTGGVEQARTDLGTADLALLTDVIEHVEHDRALLECVIGALRPGAWLVVTVPAGMELWSPHDVALGHFRRYDLASFTETWRGLPVEPALVSYFNSRLYLPVRMVRWLTTRTRRSAGGAGTDLGLPPKPLNALLRSVFAAEASRILAARSSAGPAYTRGVSLLALLRRTPAAGNTP